MTNPYVSQTVSGYNASAPPDDGSRVAANQVKWASIKSKIGDPLKTAIESINAQTLAAFALAFGNDVTAVGSNYAVSVADVGSLLSVTGATTITLLPAATAGANFPLIVTNTGTAAVTVTATELINGVSSIYLGPSESALLVSSGSTWAAMISRSFPSRLQTKLTDYTIVLADVGSTIVFTGAGTASLPTVATAGVGFKMGVLNRSTGVVLVDPNGAELVNGAATLTVPAGGFVTVICDGSEWQAFAAGDTSQTRRKTADETVNNSTALQNDDHMVGFQIKAGQYYEIEGYLSVSTTNVAYLKVAMAFSQTPQSFHMASVQTLSVATLPPFSTVYGNTVNTPSSGMPVATDNVTVTSVMIHGAFQAHATLDGTADFQWAQYAAEVSDSIVKQGSWLRITPVTQ